VLVLETVAGVHAHDVFSERAEDLSHLVEVLTHGSKTGLFAIEQAEFQIARLVRQPIAEDAKD
jgi:hypothetical protein